MKKVLDPHKVKDRATMRSFLPLVAIGGGLAATPAMALELGELAVHSSLGQPLRASIAYALAPNEMLSDACVAVGGGRSTSGLPTIGQNTVSITDSAIVITGQTPVREPMMATRVTINCAYTPNISREYMLFVDPAAVTEARAATPAPAMTPAAATIAPAVTRATRTITQPRQVDTTPISQSAAYQVQAGETLGDIASRIENRSMGLWPAVNRIFDANPDAFVNNDPNRLKAGSWLTIPSFDGAAPVVAAAAIAPIETPTEVIDGAVYEPPILEDISETVVVEEIAETAAPALAIVEEVPEAFVAEEPTPASAAAVSELRPGDIVLDAEPEGPTTASTSPNVPTAIISTGPRSESTSMLAWFIGGGLAILGILVLFGRRLRNRFGTTPVGLASAASASFEQDDNEYDLEDDSPTEENLALDADLVLGTGLADGTDMDIAQDFGFAATTELDIELPFEPVAAASDETDILPPMNSSMESILESEVLPEDEDYDLSIIVDATQMPQPEDVTERDLMAVEVTPEDATRITENYTIDKSAEFNILEQDYEDELTATQALNAEIARAAAELAESVDATASGEITREMPLATVTELDVTSELATQIDDTVETVAKRDPSDTAAVTVNMSADDQTAEMPVANDDETAEMEISGGKSG